MYDLMYEANLAYDLAPSYPITLRDFLSAICTRLGWTLDSWDFPNFDLSIAAELFTESKLTFRQVLDQIAEATGCTLLINSEDVLVVKQILTTGSSDTITYNELFSSTFKQEYTEINSVVASRMPQEDNIAQQDGGSISANGLNEIKIINNYIIDSDRVTYLDPIFDSLLDLSYFPFEANTVGLGWFEIGDRISVADNENNLTECIVWSIDLTVSGGIQEKLSAGIPDKTSTNYKYAGVVGQTIKNVQIIVDHQQGEIDILNGEMANTLALPRQSAPPDDPNINDLYLDTDDNIIYIWDGANWQPTSISPATLDGYYTKEETDSQIAITASSITSTVEDLTTTVNEQGNTIATISDDVTTLEQTATDLTLAVSGVGGVNLLLNSVGLKGTLDEWGGGTVTQTSDVTNNSESHSGITVANESIMQTVSTISGNTYTLYLKFYRTGDCTVSITGLADQDFTGSEGEWTVFKQAFVAQESTTITFTVGAGDSCILTDITLKIGDCNAWSPAPNEVYGSNYRFDKDGFSITSQTSPFKSVLDNEKLAVYDTSSGNKEIMVVSKDDAKLTNAVVQDRLQVQRYDNSANAMQIIPTTTGAILVIND